MNSVLGFPDTLRITEGTERARERLPKPPPPTGSPGRGRGERLGAELTPLPHPAPGGAPEAPGQPRRAPGRPCGYAHRADGGCDGPKPA